MFYRHGSLGDMSPSDFYQAIQNNKIKSEVIVAQNEKLRMSGYIKDLLQY